MTEQAKVSTHSFLFSWFSCGASSSSLPPLSLLGWRREDLSCPTAHIPPSSNPLFTPPSVFSCSRQGTCPCISAGILIKIHLVLKNKEEVVEEQVIQLFTIQLHHDHLSSNSTNMKKGALAQPTEESGSAIA